MTVQEIELAIAQLAPGDVAKLLTWLTEYRAQLWDEQIESDLESGRLDQLLDEVERECDAGLAQALCSARPIRIAVSLFSFDNRTSIETDSLRRSAAHPDIGGS